jgi:ferric-dicitrate binding protein FerR (iron transport regulator)
MEKNLNSDEMKEFQKDSHAFQYQQIINSTSTIQLPSFNKEASFQKIQDKIKLREYKLKIRRRNILITAALLISALIIGYFLWPKKLIITAEVGQPMAHLLPDGSQVQLNAKSTLSYDPEEFMVQRKLRLQGEAFFDVQPGNKFSVETKNGFVQVLGTSFNVLSTDKILMVSCATGKVKVEQNTIEKILGPGERIRIEQNHITIQDTIKLESISAWVEGESVYESIPLKDVVQALENQFNIAINMEKSLTEDIFTGSFIHSDQQKALEMVFRPMGLTFETIGKGKLKVAPK